MSKMKEIQITIEEVARIALEDAEMSARIGHELDLSDEWLEQVYQVLEEKLNKEV